MLRELTLILINLKNSIVAGRSIYLYIPNGLKNTFFILDFLYNEGFILNYMYKRELNLFYIYINIYDNGIFFSNFKLFNKKNSMKYMSYKEICNFLNTNTGEVLLISNSKYGIVSHYFLLKHKLGGRILCSIR